MYCTLLFKWKI